MRVLEASSATPPSDSSTGWATLPSTAGCTPPSSAPTPGENQTSWFVRAGLTYFFLGHSFYGQRPSELYVSGSYLRGLNHGRGNGALVEVGYRWMIWRGLNVRIGVAVGSAAAIGAGIATTLGLLRWPTLEWALAGPWVRW